MGSDGVLGVLGPVRTAASVPVGRCCRGGGVGGETGSVTLVRRRGGVCGAMCKGVGGSRSEMGLQLEPEVAKAGQGGGGGRGRLSNIPARSSAPGRLFCVWYIYKPRGA